MKTQENLLKQRAFIPQTNAEIERRKIRAWMYYNSTQGQDNVKPTPHMNFYEQQQQQQFSERTFQEQGYNADGSKPGWMRLAENKHFQKGADNFFLPMMEGMSLAIGPGELRALYRGLKTLTFPSSASKINLIRDFFGVKEGKNIALLEGQIGNTKIADIAISGQKSIPGTVGVPTDRVFTTKVVEFTRAYDSEVKLLENFAQQYKNTPNVQGSLKIISERPFCESCTGVIDQFKKSFPNIKLELKNGVK